MTSIINRAPYLRTSRDFPEEIHQLSVEINKSYVDIANAVNNRVIGLFPINGSILTGESWFISGNQRQQTLRQVYAFTAAGNIPHELRWNSVSKISPRSYGSFTDGTNWYGVIYASSTAIAGQLSFYVTSSDIVVLAGAGAPSISSGIIVLEWLSQV